MEWHLASEQNCQALELQNSWCPLTSSLEFRAGFLSLEVTLPGRKARRLVKLSLNVRGAVRALRTCLWLLIAVGAREKHACMNAPAHHQDKALSYYPYVPSWNG